MNKISFLVQRNDAASAIYTCNGGLWMKDARDPRTVLSLLSNRGAGLRYFYFTEKGCFITTVRDLKIRGRFLTAHVFVPNTIVVSGQRIAELLDLVDHILQQTTLSEIIPRMESEFGQTYPENPNPPALVSAGKRFALRTPGTKHSLATILDQRYQEAYANYQAVVLTDAASINPDYTGNVDNLTAVELFPMAVAAAPEPMEEEPSKQDETVESREDDAAQDVAADDDVSEVTKKVEDAPNAPAEPAEPEPQPESEQDPQPVSDPIAEPQESSKEVSPTIMVVYMILAFFFGFGVYYMYVNFSQPNEKTDSCQPSDSLKVVADTCVADSVAVDSVVLESSHHHRIADTARYYCDDYDYYYDEFEYSDCTSDVDWDSLMATPPSPKKYS